MRRRDVALWPVASISAVQRNVRSWVNSGDGRCVFETALLTRNGRAQISNECLILGVKPTSKIRAITSAFDAKRTRAFEMCRNGLDGLQRIPPEREG
jgi:hypothetical protein